MEENKKTIELNDSQLENADGGLEQDQYSLPKCPRLRSNIGVYSDTQASLLNMPQM